MTNDDNSKGAQIPKYEGPTQFKRVFEAEREHLGMSNQDGLCGLAISGGGIRSASFGLGVMQALMWGGVLQKMDYLSTVSGGGYIGSALTWWLSKNGFGLDGEKRFPFGKKFSGAREQISDDPNAVIDFIRQHGSYLSPGKGLNVLSMGAITLRAMFVSLLIHFLWLTLAMMALTAIISLVPESAVEWLYSRSPVSITDQVRPDDRIFVMAFYWLLVLLGAAFVVGSVSYSIATVLGPILSEQARYTHRTSVQIAFGWTLELAVVFVVIGLLPVVYNSLSALQLTSAASFPTVVGGLLGLLQHRRQQQRVKPKKRSGTLLPTFGAVLVLWGLLLGSFSVAAALRSWDEAILVGVMLTLVALFLSLAVNINDLGIHRTYRDRLMETFLPDWESVRKNSWGYASESNTALIEHMCKSPNLRPYHLINTNIVLVDSKTSRFRGRGGDSFLVSPLYCGSYATGWRRSDDYMKFVGKKWKRDKKESGSAWQEKGLEMITAVKERGASKRGMTLPTAMAISGAAANPNAGVGGRGLTRNRMVSTLMSLLNIRLGYWAPHPNPNIASPYFEPNFLYPGLRGGVLPGGLHEDRKYVELTDGGHFENLAIYELIRRRLKLIIVCDGGADPHFEFGDLANAVERVKVDFGTKIRFEKDENSGDDKFGLRWLLPKSGKDKLLNKKYHLAKRGFAVGKIDYSEHQSGCLIYIKTTLTEGLPPDVYGYKSANPTFPDQSTADQFFDEAQFEAYRELGYYLGKQFLDDNKTHGWISAG